MPLLLASASPRRQALLRAAGIDFRVVVPRVEEHNPERGDAHAVAVANARAKAESVTGETVLAADTVVCLGDRLLGKPTDGQDARRILSLLSGTTHGVVTGVALRHRRRLATRSVETRVSMRPWTAEELDAYVASGEAMGKAGAYAIQESADRFVTALDGPYDNVVGLPVGTVRELLDEAAASGGLDVSF